MSLERARAVLARNAAKRALDGVTWRRLDFNPDQPRAADGKFGDAGAASSKAESATKAANTASSDHKASAHESARDAHYQAADANTRAGNTAQAAKHEKAALEHARIAAQTRNQTQRLPTSWAPTHQPSMLVEPRRRHPRNTASLATTTKLPTIKP